MQLSDYTIMQPTIRNGHYRRIFMLDLAKGYFERFTKLDKLQRKYFHKALEEYNFTPNEIVVLLFLYNNAPDFDTATDIANYRGISKGLVARSVEALCKRGYLEAVRDPDDRRVFHLRLTGGIHSIGSEISELRKQFTSQIEEGISQEDIDATNRTLARLTENVEKLLEGDSMK